MRLRIVHQLSLLMLATVVLSVVAVGGLVAWNLKAGFSDYLRTRDQQQLERFAQVVAERMAWDRGLGPGRGKPMPMRELMDEFLFREGMAPPPDWRAPPEGGQGDAQGGRGGRTADDPSWRVLRPGESRPDDSRSGGRLDAMRRERPGPPGRPPPRADGSRPFAGPDDDRPGPPPGPPEPPPPREEEARPAVQQEPSQPPQSEAGDARAADARPRLPRPGPDSITQRIQVVDPQGRHMGGPQFPEGRSLLEEPVRVRGQTVALVRMLPATQAEGVDARFLRRQYTGLVAAAGGSLALALLAAWFAAGWLGGPLRRVQLATRRIAGGELGVVVPESGSREMAELIGDVNRMAAALKTLEGARRSWIAQISHELRTPLSVLLGEIESIEDGARQPTPEVLAGLRAEVMQLVRLVEDLHTLSMADLGALRCEFIDGDASAALARAVHRFEPRARKAGLEVDILAGPPVQAHWDFGRIEQLLTNLLENSLRYTLAPGKVRVQWATDGASLALRVEDTPPGVPPAQLAQVFEPLFRADSARQRRATPGGPAAGGSGLGLAICRAIVQAHGGRIEAMASPLGGLGIVASLPLQPPER